MSAFLAILRENAILLLFLIAALGQLLGHIRIMGFSLGVSAVLFVGLFFGALDPAFKLPDFVMIFGLSLFVYTMGLSSGPSFFLSLHKKGLRDNALALSLLIVMTLLCLLIGRFLLPDASYAAGLFAGALTNTPALAAILDTLKASGASEQQLVAPVVAYSLSYPFGVLGMLLAINLLFRLRPVSHDSQQETDREEEIESRVIRLTQTQWLGKTLGELRRAFDGKVSFARIQHKGEIHIAEEQTRLTLGDLLSAVGRASDLKPMTEQLGEVSAERLDLDRSHIDFRRIFVSQKNVTEIPLHHLNLSRRFGATITRIRRGDVELIPSEQTLLQLGDRVRVVAPRDQFPAISAYLGDSYKALSEFDVITFSLGLALGLVLGKIPWPLPGGGHFELGFAGGPLLAALIFGKLGRTGSFVWVLPFSVNLTLRQLGLILFLAGIGSRSGLAFAQTLERGGGILPFIIGGFFITAGLAALFLLLGTFLFRIKPKALAGMLAGLQTQPAVLAYACEQAKDDSPNAAYASIYPLAMIAKIILAQLMLT